MQVYRCIELCIRCFFYQLNCFRDGVAFCFIYFFIDLPVLFSSSLRLFMLLGLGFSRTCYFFFFKKKKKKKKKIFFPRFSPQYILLCPRLFSWRPPNH